MKLTGFKPFFSVNEAKWMVNDREKPVAVQNVVGWKVYFYDREQDGHDRNIRRMTRYRNRITAGIDGFLKDHGGTGELMNTAEISLKTALARNQIMGKVMQNHGQLPLHELDEQEAEAVREFIVGDLFIAITDAARFYHDDAHAFKLKDFIASHRPDPNEPVHDLVTKAYQHTFMQLPKFLEQVRRGLDNPPTLNRVGSATPQEVMSKSMPAITDALVRLEQIGVRKFHKVPVRVYVVHEYPSIHGTTDKMGGDAETGLRLVTNKPSEPWEKNRSDTQKVNIYLIGTETPEAIRDVVIHEVGHILFNSSPDLQRLVQQMSHAMPPPSDYGNVNYVYGGNTKPNVNHKSGNEWFAEMLMTITTGKPSPFTPRQVMQFKQALATIGQSNHPHTGVSYRVGQTDADYQFPPQTWQQPEPPVPVNNFKITKPGEQIKKRQLSTRDIPGSDDYTG
jgi:hypothetical protein